MDRAELIERARKMNLEELDGCENREPITDKGGSLSMPTRREMLNAELFKELAEMSAEQLEEICAFMDANKAGQIEITEAGFQRFHEEYQKAHCRSSGNRQHRR